jgi:myo-inositol-1(or 4)-monophosphatase
MAGLTRRRARQEKSINLDIVQDWLREAGNIALTQRNQLSPTSKPDGTLVTDVDHQIEKLLHDRITQSYPGHQILAEEGTSNRIMDSDYLWTIDPIDGTRAYVSGLPIWGISVGILKRGIPYAGLFFMPATDEMYGGTAKEPFLNNTPLSSLNHTDLQDPSAFIAVPSNTHRQYEISFPRLRSLGSATAHLAYVVRGAALAALTRNIYIWDIAPILPLAKANDIELVYLSGKKIDLNRLLDGSLAPEPMLAAPSKLIEQIRGLIHPRSNT